MPNINFPSSPTNGQIYTFNGDNWVFNGVAWVGETSGGTTLQQVSDAGGLSNGTNIIQGPLGGIALLCTVNLVLEWYQGALYSLDSSNLIEKVQFKTIAPTVDDDETLSFKIGSYWEMNDGKRYQCTDDSDGSAVWILQLEKGQNYVIVQTVNTGAPSTDAITNGQSLLAGLTQLNSLDWGTRSLDNMGTLLLMPGIYDLFDQTIEMIDFINIVGISTNRRDTIITASSMTLVANQIHINWGPHVTSGLQNVELIADLVNNAIMLGGDDTSFPIIENVYMGSENMLFNNVQFGFQNLVGKWNNIEFGNVTYAFIAGVDISGTISNITMGDVTWGFYAGNDISGTISNITMGDVGNGFYASGNISGTISNVTMGDVANDGFYAQNSISGTISDVTMGNVATGFYAAGNISGTISDVTMGDVTSYGFYADNDISGTISNITMGDVDIVFNAQNSILGNISNITMGDVVSFGFRARNGDISGNISNITMGDVDNGFYAAGNISGTISNITMGDTNVAIRGDTTISGTISHLITNGYFVGSLTGKLYDSIINCIGKTHVPIDDVRSGAVIERCKVLSYPGYTSIDTTVSPVPFPITVQILYTLTNGSISNISPPGTNYNINDPGFI